MESVSTFMDVFQRSWKEGDNGSLATILKNGNNYFKNVPKNEGERVLEIIFEKERGLLKFIQSKLLSTNLTQFNGSVKEAFNISQWIMEFFKNDYEPYITQTRDLCFTCIKSNCWFYLRKTAAETLKKLIELFPSYDMTLNKIVRYYNEFYPERYTTKDGCMFYIVLGAIAKNCPTTMSNSADSIYMHILRDLKNQYKENNAKQPEEIKIYMDCLSNMLVNYIPFEGREKQEAYFKKLYYYILELSKPMQAQKTVRAVALYIFTEQMKHFSKFITSDYLMWHTLLNSIFEEADNYTAFNAVRTFYKTMGENMLEGNGNDIFSFFKTEFITSFGSESSLGKKKRLIICGLGELAAAYAKYLPGEMYEIFQMLAVRALPFHEKEEVNEEFEAITDYLQALSKFLIHMPRVTMHQLNIVIELSICLAKKFPQYKATFQVYSTKVLKIIFGNISQLDRNLQSEYFTSFFREGILWSCSHALSIDVELQQEIEPNEENVCYKNYLSFWQSIFQDEDPLFLQIFDYFIQTLTTFIDKLNLNLTAEENECFSNPLLSMKAVNENDYRFFINLTDLYSDIFDSTDSVLFQNWIERLFIYFIKSSYTHPLVSGFYKFLEVILKKPDVFSDYEDGFNPTTRELISQYLADVAIIIPTYSGELQLSCINLIFSIPSFFVSDLTDKLVAAFKIAFHIGLTNLSLAFNALETLEKWSRSSDVKFSNEFYMQIVYFLEPYLSSEESSVDMFEGGRKKQKNTKNVIMNVDDNLEVLQKKILLFYGSLDSTILFDFIHQRTIVTDATWNKKDLLQCELLYSDCRLEIHYDKFILRIIDLTKSGDRQTKLSACEFLHSMITIILGKKLMDKCFNKNLCRTILSLGCDPDDVIRNLYHPLVIQLTHFLSSQLMRDSRVPQDFLDCLFEGFSEEFNPSLKDYCGIYLKEFTQWSIKQSTENNLTDVPNIRSVLLRITNLASYPSDKNQRAAAVAFNYIHSTLAVEHNDVINTYWLEFLYVFVKSMENSCSIEIITAIDHIESDVKLKANVFLAKSPYRRKPAFFVKETLIGTLIWLFDECGTLNVKCRLRRMKLFENLFALVTDRNRFQDSVLKNVDKIALKDLKKDVTIENANVFLKSLDFYVWVLQKKIITVEALFTDENDLNLFSKCFSNFLNKIVNENAESLDNAKLFDLFGEISLKILAYAAVISQIDDNNPMAAILHNKDFYSLLSLCILNPSSVGLTAKKLELIEKLPNHLDTLLTSIIDNPQGQQCKEIILNDTREKSSQGLLIDLNQDTHALRDFVKGLITLKKCKFIDFEKELDFDNAWVEEILKELFGLLKVEIMYDDTCKKLDDNIKNYFEILLNFLLLDCQNQILKILITLLMNDNPLLRPNGSVIPHGEYFLETFKTPVLQCLISNSSSALKIIDEFLIESPNKSFLIIEELVSFAKTHKDESLFDEIIQRFNKLKRHINDLPHRQDTFLNIYRIVVTLKKKPTDAVKNSDLYWWIIEQLMSATELEKKNTILRNFLVCLVDESTANHELSLNLRQLRHQDSAMCLLEFKSNESVKYQAASCHQILLKSLIATKSPSVYEALLKFSAGILETIFKGNTRDYLTPYFSSITETTALKSLQLAYKTFMDLSSTRDRLDILHHFLLPSIECSNFSVVNSFYTETHADMITIISSNAVYENRNDTLKLSTSKLGCFKIFETLFARFDLPILKINDKAINQLIVQQTLETRRLSSANRLLHCAALNCCISLVSLKDEQKYYKFVFNEDRRKDQLLWERIVDCDRKYTFTEDSSSIRKERKKLLNIRRKVQPMPHEYPRKLELTSLTLLENIHAYDLNDTRLLAQPKTDGLLGLSFENDELNNHECMPMLVGLLVHMFDNAIATTDKTDELPDFLKMFRNGFGTQKNNAKLFLLRILSNVKQAFLPFMSHFFLAVVSTLSSYLASDALNYIIRDTLLILVESKVKPKSDQEKLAANRLLQRLIERAPEEQDVQTRYNIHLLESLWTNWCDDVTWPGEATVKSPIAARISLVVLRSQAAETFSRTNEAKTLRDLIIENLEQTNVKESEANIIASFETLGWLLKLNVAEESLVDKLDVLLITMEIKNVDRSAKCVCALYRGWNSEEGCKKMFRFTSRSGRLSDSVKPQCIELFTSRLEKLDPSVITAELSLMNLKHLLLNHALSCEGPILTLLEKLAPLLSENELKSYTDIVSNPYYSEAQCCILENRRRAYKFLAAAKCFKPLIRALALEPSDELRRELLDFWTTKLPEGCQDRLVELLKLYEPNVGFSRFLCLLMLELTKKAPDNKRTMFRPLNDQVVFREYELLVPWRRRNLASCAPLFLPSLASASQTLQHKQIASSCNSQFSQGAYWQPLLSYTPTLPEPSRNKLSRRTFTERLNTDGYHDKLRIQAKSKVGTRRSYRIGELPDIDMSQETFVDGLQQIVVKDAQCCRQMTVCILERLIERAREDENETRRNRLLNVVIGVIEKASDDFGPIILESVLHCQELLKKVDVAKASRICHTLGHHSLATLLLEQRLISKENNEEDDSRPSKLPRLQAEINDERELWSDLANLYRSIESIDVVSGIFSRLDVFSTGLRQAALSHAAADWLEAKKVYQLAFDQGLSTEKQYSFEGTLECLRQLGSWKVITEKLENVDVRQHDRKEYLLPRLIESQLHQALDELTNNVQVSNKEFIKNLDSWLGESRMDFPEEMCVFYLCGKDSQSSARHALKHAVDRLRDRWIKLDEKKPVELRAVYNIYAYAQLLKSQDVEAAAKELMREWEVNGPQLGQDLLSWNKLVGYRLTFVHLLHEKIQNDESESSLLNDLVAAGVSQKMKLSNMAISLGNNIVAKKHTFGAERILDNLSKDDYPKLHEDFLFTASKYKFLCAKIETNAGKRAKYYAGAWKIADGLLKEAPTRLDVKHHIFDVTDELRSAVENNLDINETVTQDKFVVEKLRLAGEEDLSEALKEYSYKTLKGTCETGESFAKFGKYCYGLLRHDPNVIEDFVSAILTGMSLGSLQAAQYFSCLLKYQFYRNNESTTRLFVCKCENVPSWLFLSWQAQIMSYLNTPLGELLVPIIRRLAKDYPKAILYNFKQSYESFPELKEKDNMRSIYEGLFGDGKMEKFFEAMHRVCQPELYFRHFLLKIFEESKDHTTALDSLLSNQDTDLQGPLYKILEKLKPRIERMKTLDYETAKKFAEDICFELYESMKIRLDKGKLHSIQLKDYSKYLSSFSSNEFEIEIPGQYVDGKRPLPQYHVTISRFDRFVKVMESKWNPIRINMIGNDAKSYGYLVKFGEDLRQDQRLQQIFRLTNKTLDNDVKCRQRYLSVNTYHVVPLSTMLGLIEWVDETRSLKEFVEFSMKGKTVIENVAGMYQSWIEQAKRPGRQSYKEALLKYNSKDVVTKMEQLIDYIDWDCLRRSFMNVSTSLQCFITLRHNFVTSYATMCLIHWLTGVGDRHLENILVKVKTGKCCGIDFGAAFGAGVDQFVPELVPFRLTPQILGLFQPFDEQALFGITMTHVLNALRNEKAPILAFLDTFVYEPIDWSKHTKKKLKENDEQGKDVRWMPKKRISVIEQKLNGVKPSKIMIEELSNMHDDGDEGSEYFSMYEIIVNGNDRQHLRIRSNIKDESLTPKEQVQCLLDQATDLNLLGRMWVGWMPFV